MTLLPGIPPPAAPPPSLDRATPNRQGGGANGEQTHRPRSDAAAASTVRRRLAAIARDRLAAIPLGGEKAELWRKLEAGWLACGWTTLYRNPASGTVVGLPDHCDRILCPYCELRRVSKIRDRYRPRADAALAEGRLFLATLTIPNVDPGDLEASLERIRKAIAKLRRRRWWLEAADGGLWRLEVTINLRTRTWHPHANLIFETKRPIRMADFQPLLQAEWRSVLGEDAQQWVWLVPGWSGALPEAVKRQLQEARPPAEAERHGQSSIDYTVKPDPHYVDPSDPAWVIEYVEALAGRRAVSSFGAWRGMPVPPSDPTEQLVEAPYAPGDDFFATRHLPQLDPLTDQPADWEPFGRGPRWALRPFRPPGEGRQEWLVWRSGDGPDPGAADDDTALVYQAALVLAGITGRHDRKEDPMPLPSEYRRRLNEYADRHRPELRTPSDLGVATGGELYVAAPLEGDAPDGYRRGRCGSCAGGVALPRSGVAYWSALPILCSVCAP